VIEELADAIDACAGDPAARCVIARGAGDHFSAVDDLFDTAAADRAEWHRNRGRLPALSRATLRAPVPIVAAVDGWFIPRAPRRRVVGRAAPHRVATAR
jgi:enoyl-CoA hydratase/carnithine racemase